MSVLLDTNSFIWLTDSKRLHNIGKRARRVLEQSDVVYVSSITVVEIHMKTMLHKLKLASELSELIESAGLVNLEFSATHADAMTNFLSLVRHDPFDRMLLAQAQAEGITLLTADLVLLGLDLAFVLDVRE